MARQGKEKSFTPRNSHGNHEYFFFYLNIKWIYFVTNLPRFLWVRLYKKDPIHVVDNGANCLY